MPRASVPCVTCQVRARHINNNSHFVLPRYLGTPSNACSPALMDTEREIEREKERERARERERERERERKDREKE